MTSLVAVLEWRAWDRFLVTRVLRETAMRVEVDPFHGLPSEDFERICDSAAVVCFHINLSVLGTLPLDTRALSERFQERGLHVVNGWIQDIRKPSLHQHLESIGLRSPAAAPEGPQDEILFLKTSLNHGGLTERGLAPEVQEACGFGPLIASNMGAYQYCARRRRELSDEIWRDPALVVEKFVHNPEHSFYRTYFSGQNVIVVKAHAPGAVKKMSGDPRDINYVSDLPHLRAGTDGLPISEDLKADIVTFIDATPVEFGCADILHDGKGNYYVVDLNPTPYAGDPLGDDLLNDHMRAGMTDPSHRKPYAPRMGHLARISHYVD